MTSRTRAQRSSSFTSDIAGDTVMTGDQSTTMMEEPALDNNNNLHDIESAESLQIPCEHIRVQAPSDLPGGYQMETEVNGQPVLVTVPKTGVLQGDIFTPAAASLLSDIHLSIRGGAFDKSKQGLDIPVGAWRDGFWNICILGPAHPTFWNSCCCPLLAAGQVITRMQLTWYGTPAANVAQVSIAFQVLVMILVAYFAVRAFLFLLYAYLDPNTDPENPIYIEPPPSYFFFTAFDDLLFYMYVAFVVVVLRNIRSHLRARYAIPESDTICCPQPGCPLPCCCRGCEDICCSLIFPCCTVAQMMRHTADYQVHQGNCCSSTGLVKTAPAIVV